MAHPVTAIAADHAGFELKTYLKEVLEQEGLPVVDLGTHSADAIDYPDIARQLAQALKDGRADRGVIICGSGLGVSMAANRHPWVRAAPCHDVVMARLAREHNDANVLALGARLIAPQQARDVLVAFLHTPFAGGRHARRVAKLQSGRPLEP